jgi:mercuric ion binding protein
MPCIVVALALILAVHSARAAERTVRLHVENMICAACPVAVRAAIGRVPGVKEVKVDFGDKTAIVVFDDAKAAAEDLAEASRLAGFPASIEEQSGD